MNAQPIYTLDALPVGEKAKVICVKAGGSDRRRLLDLGLVPGTVIESIRKSPAGDPTAIGIRGAVIALRSEEASKVLVELFSA